MQYDTPLTTCTVYTIHMYIVYIYIDTKIKNILQKCYNEWIFHKSSFSCHPSNKTIQANPSAPMLPIKISKFIFENYEFYSHSKILRHRLQDFLIVVVTIQSESLNAYIIFVYKRLKYPTVKNALRLKFCHFHYIILH